MSNPRCFSFLFNTTRSFLLGTGEGGLEWREWKGEGTGRGNGAISVFPGMLISIQNKQKFLAKLFEM